MFGLTYVFIKLFILMFKLMMVTLVVCAALYVWLFLGIAWLVSPNKSAVTRSTRNFNHSLTRTIRHVM